MRAQSGRTGGARALHLDITNVHSLFNVTYHMDKSNNKLHDELRSSQEAIAWIVAETAGPTATARARGTKQRTAGRHLEAVIRPAA